MAHAPKGRSFKLLISKTAVDVRDRESCIVRR